MEENRWVWATVFLYKRENKGKQTGIYEAELSEKMAGMYHWYDWAWDVSDARPIPDIWLWDNKNEMGAQIDIEKLLN